MNWPGELKRRLQMLFHRRAFQRELEEEMKLHLDLREAQQIEDGTAPEAARVATRRLFGNTTRIREESNMRWGWEAG